MGEIDTIVVLLILTLEFEGGNLIKNLCGVVGPLFLEIKEDLVLQNCCCYDRDEEQ